MAIVFVTAGPWGPGTGVPHSAAVADGIIYELLQRIVALETTPPVAISIDDFSIIGDQLTILLTDLTSRVITVPTAKWFPLGEWTPLTVYARFSVVSNSGRLYLINEAHTSAAVFDADAVGVGPLYIKILDPPIQPNDFHIFLAGTLLDDQLIMFTETIRRWQLPLDLIGSLYQAQVAATDETIIILKKNGTEIGRLTWAAAGSFPTVDFASAVTFDTGDFFSIHGPATADATLADINFDLFGYRI